MESIRITNFDHVELLFVEEFRRKALNDYKTKIKTMKHNNTPRGEAGFGWTSQESGPEYFGPGLGTSIAGPNRGRAHAPCFTSHAAAGGYWGILSV